MTIEHRKAGVLNQVLQQTVNNLVDNLARVDEENETLRAKIAKLEQDAAALKPAPVSDPA